MCFRNQCVVCKMDGLVLAFFSVIGWWGLTFVRFAPLHVCGSRSFRIPLGKLRSQSAWQSARTLQVTRWQELNGKIRIGSRDRSLCFSEVIVARVKEPTLGQCSISRAGPMSRGIWHGPRVLHAFASINPRTRKFGSASLTPGAPFPLAVGEGRRPGPFCCAMPPAAGIVIFD